MFAAFSTVHPQNSFLMSGYSCLYPLSYEWIMLDFRDTVGKGSLERITCRFALA